LVGLTPAPGGCGLSAARSGGRAQRRLRGGLGGSVVGLGGLGLAAGELVFRSSGAMVDGQRRRLVAVDEAGAVDRERDAPSLAGTPGAGADVRDKHEAPAGVASRRPPGDAAACAALQHVAFDPR
jgi:hypothetical protein